MPAGPVFQAGTLSGNPLAMAAGLATLRELRERPPYAALEALGQKLERELPKLCAERRIPHHFARAGSMWTLFFTGTPVVDYDTAKTCDTARFGRFFWAMLERGIYLPCSQFEAAFLSAAMTPAHIDETLTAARESLDAIRG
jgi:glutamate-1-semialdehyde 2,1-aminomutase